MDEEDISFRLLDSKGQVVMRVYAWNQSDERCANLQLHFWRSAVEQFEALKDADIYSFQYPSRAAHVIVLAWTSVTQLLGQNAPPKNSQSTPSSKKALQSLLESNASVATQFNNLKQDFDEAIEIYDAIRHFGPVKHKKLDQALDDSNLLPRMMLVAQSVWRFISEVRQQEWKATPDFNYDFEMNAVDEARDNDLNNDFQMNVQRFAENEEEYPPQMTEEP